MTDKHTPGPWRIESNNPLIILASDGEEPPWHVAKAFTECQDDETSKANAELIAAAPETADELDRLREANIAMTRVAEGEHLRAIALHRKNVAEQDRLKANLRADTKLMLEAVGRIDKLKAVNAELLTTLNLVITEISQDAHEHELIICNIERLACAAIAKAKEPTA